MTRWERFLALLAILAAFAGVVAISYLTGPAPEPNNCGPACATKLHKGHPGEGAAAR